MPILLYILIPVVALLSSYVFTTNFRSLLPILKILRHWRIEIT